MIDIIRSDSRGGADHGWLKARHTFSFADYYDPKRCVRTATHKLIANFASAPA